MDAEEGMISPGGVGYDINCGVRLIKTNLNEKDVRPRLRDLVTELFKSIPSGVGSKGPVKLSSSNLDEELERGEQWAVNHGYGFKDDANECEENEHIKKQNPSKESPKARKR